MSQKGARPGQTSHYYSLTRLHTTGSVSVDDKPLAVEGISWMDHEFGSGELAANFGRLGLVLVCKLDNEHEIMAYGLRRADGTFDPASSGTLVFSGWFLRRHFALQDWEISVNRHWTSPTTGARYPHHWSFFHPEYAASVNRVSSYVSPRTDHHTQYRSGPIGRDSVDVTGHWEGPRYSGDRVMSKLTGLR